MPLDRLTRRAARASTGLLATALVGCALQHDTAPPLQPAALQARWAAVSADDPLVRAALARQGVDVAVWPLPRWNAAALDALALAVHPELAVARAEVAQAQAGRLTAAQRAAPSLDVFGEHHSVPNATDSPWSVGIALDVGLADTWLGQDRRRALAAAADARTDAAVLHAADTAWMVHRRVRDSLHALWSSQRAAASAAAMAPLADEEQAMVATRLALGATDARDAATARRQAAVARQAAAEAQATVRADRLRLADAIGIAPEQVERLAIDLHDLDAAAVADPAPRPALQRAALLDRLDLRVALAAHAAADADLRVQLARQHPELRLRPGYEWDQGDNRWQLGLGLSLPSWDLNAGSIAEARAARDRTAAQVVALQAQAIGELATAEAALGAATVAERAAVDMHAAAVAAADRAARRLAAGDADRLETVIARRDLIAAVADIDLARARRAGAEAALEDAVQRPLAAVGAATGAMPQPSATAARGATPQPSPTIAPWQPSVTAPAGAMQQPAAAPRITMPPQLGRAAAP